MLNQFIKFVGVGGINTIVTYLLYLLLLTVLSYSVAYTITYLFGIGLSYWLNLKFVFKEKSSTKKVILFPLVYLAQYIFGILILYVAIEKLDISEKLAPLLVVVISIPVTFILTKKILTKKENKHVQL